jgi:hypothetical protein
MPADDSVFFIDSNKYLDLYSKPTVKDELATVEAHTKYLFVTRVCADEIQRNKLHRAAVFLNQEAEKMKTRYVLVIHQDVHDDVLKKLDEAKESFPKWQTFGVPDQFGGKIEAIRKQMKDNSHNIKATNQQIETLFSGIIDKISRSEDEVSRVLARIFAKATGHTDDQLRKARLRKELGKPPGKEKGAIGDELNWEQILTQFQQGKKRLWIVSRDRDYGMSFNGRTYLNPYLYEELRAIRFDAQAFLFDNIVDAIKHFGRETGVEAEKVPSDEVLKQIKKEEKYLPPLGWLQGNSPLLASGNIPMSGGAAIISGQIFHAPDLLPTYFSPQQPLTSWPFSPPNDAPPSSQSD